MSLTLFLFRKKFKVVWVLKRLFEQCLAHTKKALWHLALRKYTQSSNCSFQRLVQASYSAIKATVEGQQWANDIDDACNCFAERFHHSLRYAENHDEVRLASKGNWAASGMEIGKPVSAILFGMGRGPLMIYSGQETGEPADALAR